MAAAQRTAVAAEAERRGWELVAVHEVQAASADGGSPRVMGAVQRVTGVGYLVTEPKTRRSRRRVELTDAAVDALLLHRSSQSAERLRAGSMCRDRGLVFPNATGDYCDKSLLGTGLHALLAAAELPSSPTKAASRSCRSSAAPGHRAAARLINETL